MKNLVLIVILKRTDCPMQLKNIHVYILLSTAFSGGIACAQEVPNAFSEPSTAYLSQFRNSGVRQFILERYDANGALHERTVEVLRQGVKIFSATRRQFNNHVIDLRGLQPCPRDLVFYSGRTDWKCKDAAADYMTAIYNERASVVLCKTLVLNPDPGEVTPSSCFSLVGDNKLDPFDVVNDDDTMVFLGLAGISVSADGRSLRPDLAASKALSIKEGFGGDVQ